MNFDVSGLSLMPCLFVFKKTRVTYLAHHGTWLKDQQSLIFTCPFIFLINHYRLSDCQLWTGIIISSVLRTFDCKFSHFLGLSDGSEFPSPAWGGKTEIREISQGCQRFETSVFFSEKINISTTGGSRVGFFQPDTNHP